MVVALVVVVVVVVVWRPMTSRSIPTILYCKLSISLSSVVPLDLLTVVSSPLEE